MRKREIIIKKERCKGCGLCVWICPHGVLAISKEEMNSKGYHPVKVVNPDKCVECRLCEYICPEFAIFLVEKEVIEAVSRIGGQ